MTHFFRNYSKFWFGVAILMGVATMFLPTQSVFGANIQQDVYISPFGVANFSVWSSSSGTGGQFSAFSTTTFPYVAATVQSQGSYSPSFSYDNVLSGSLFSPPFYKDFESIFPVDGVYTFFILTSGGVPSAPFTATDSIFASFSRSGGVWSSSILTNPDDTRTRIISVSPIDGSVLASSTDPLTFQVQYYVNADDIFSTNWFGQQVTTPLTIKYGVSGISYFGQMSPDECRGSAICSTVAGGFDFSTTTVAVGFNTLTLSLTNTEFTAQGNGQIGTHISSVSIAPPASFLGYFSKTNALSATTTSWVFGALNFADKTSPFMASSTARMNASSTLDFSACNMLSGNFSATECFGDLMASLFVPNDYKTQATMNVIHDNILNRFPLGYVTNFIDILASSTATTSVPLISATIPQGIPGAGASISLSIDHVLDPILNATTSQFVGLINGAPPSTESLYTITERYWEYVVYILLGMYLVSRIFGSGIIGLGKKV